MDARAAGRGAGAGRARQIMLVAEAARAAGLAGDAAAMGRLACAMIPAVLEGPGGVASLGCIGNRVYTGLGADELSFTIPGARVGEVVGRLGGPGDGAIIDPP
jgi:uncharacterized protein (DUF169 family)